MLPKHPPIPIRSDAFIKLPLPYLCSCASFACTFIPTSLCQPALLIFCHLKEKVQKKPLPDLPPFDHQNFPEGKATLLFPGSLYIFFSAWNTLPHFLLVNAFLVQYHLLQEIFPNPDSKLNQQPPTGRHSSWALFYLCTESTGLLLSGSGSEFPSVYSQGSSLCL